MTENIMSQGEQLRYWRNAATLIITGQTKEDVNWDYKVLMLQRSKDSAFFPGAYVFPGGTTSDVDSSKQWSSLYSQVVSMTTDDIAKDLKVPGPRPPMMSSGVLAGNLTPDQTVDSSIALRICAIRETFEESGLLLATRIATDRKELTTPDSVYNRDRLGPDIEIWREKVHADPWNFLVMCRELKVVPNVWALVEWSNWLTPVMRQVKGPSKRPHRFDTIFYVICLDHIPAAMHDAQEVTNTRWIVPKQVAGGAFPEKFRGPQGYELSRLANFSHLDKLFVHIREREPLGLEEWLPTIFGCKNGVVSAMPGDGLYPKYPDREGTKPIVYFDKTVKELRKETINLHRNEQDRKGTFRFVCNIKLKYGQISPLDHTTQEYLDPISNL